MHKALSLCLNEVSADRAPEVVAGAVAHHLGRFRSTALPTEAQAAWHAIARLLKCNADHAIPERAIASIKSWPADRIANLIEHLTHIHTILEKHENDRLEDDIRDKIRRHYL